MADQELAFSFQVPAEFEKLVELTVTEFCNYVDVQAADNPHFVQFNVTVKGAFPAYHAYKLGYRIGEIITGK